MNRQQLGVIYGKNDGRCWYCGVALPPFDEWEIEHQHPRSRGGSNTIENLVAACRRCNALKGPRTVEEYRRRIIAQLENKIQDVVDVCYEIHDLTGCSKEFFLPEPLLRIHDLICEAHDLIPEAWVSFSAEGELSNINPAEKIDARIEGEM